MGSSMVGCYTWPPSLALAGTHAHRAGTHVRSPYPAAPVGLEKLLCCSYWPCLCSWIPPTLALLPSQVTAAAPGALRGTCLRHLVWSVPSDPSPEGVVFTAPPSCSGSVCRQDLGSPALCVWYRSSVAQLSPPHPHKCQQAPKTDTSHPYR